jgi:thiosulfate dehydrogenase [quinone] large subunit
MKKFSYPEPEKFLTMNKPKKNNYSTFQLFSLTFLRVLIGWHFLYEGVVKLFSDPPWSAESYLINSAGPFSGLFREIASYSSVLAVVDFMNMWGLILIGISLFLGILTKLSTIFAMVLLFFYYLAYPPFSNVVSLTEGHFWIVNYNLIEIGALYVLYLFPSSQFTGLDRYFKRNLYNHKA